MKRKRPITRTSFKIVISFLFITLCLQCIAQTNSIHNIPDGLYLITRTDTTNINEESRSTKEIEIRFNKLFLEFSSDEYLKIFVDTAEYAPLILEKVPTTEQQTEAKKKLLLTLTKEASERLKIFTSKHLSKHVVLVVDGEALTIHKIKEPITSGLLQITRCDDNACEILNLTLKDNVQKTN